MSIYVENGYADRDEYLRSLSEDYDMALETVYAIADTLGPTEDFDGLVAALDGAEDLIY